MMGTKTRSFSPLPRDVSLEDLVPKDHFYRRLEERINLSFVRELVLPLYASGGRHSIDPVVFFKLQLVLFFENLRSERRLMEVVADRLSLRCYVGYDLHEPLPDHSSLTKIRERYGLEIFRDFFERIVEMCFEAGLLRSRELFFDSTKIEADAAVDSLAPRWFVEAHLHDLFEGDDVRRQKGAEDPQETEEEIEAEGAVRGLPTARDEDLLLSSRASEDWISRNDAQDRSFKGTSLRERIRCQEGSLRLLGRRNIEGPGRPSSHTEPRQDRHLPSEGFSLCRVLPEAALHHQQEWPLSAARYRRRVHRSGQDLHGD